MSSKIIDGDFIFRNDCNSRIQRIFPVTQIRRQILKVSTLAHFFIPVNYWNRPQTVELDNSWELNLASHNECLRAKRIQQPIRIIASEIEPSEIADEIKGSSNIPIFYLDAAFKTKNHFKKSNKKYVRGFIIGIAIFASPILLLVPTHDTRDPRTKTDWSRTERFGPGPRTGPDQQHLEISDRTEPGPTKF